MKPVAPRPQMPATAGRGNMDFNCAISPFDLVEFPSGAHLSVPEKHVEEDLAGRAERALLAGRVDAREPAVDGAADGLVEGAPHRAVGREALDDVLAELDE